ncbi:small ribosomal subunit protein mS37 [Halichoeres trimaculatus]|uniref:small ribosomal subunit protein mS37 n=1 Tax=Halichoeres trimaculatus TaxID=147232 RepID=UPI003D9EE8E6
MAVQAGGAAIQEKVNRLLSKQNRRPVIKPNRPLVLLDSVANRKPKKGEATCIAEMSTLMVCWRKNNFVESFCSTETKKFYDCVKNAKMMKGKSNQSKLQGGQLPPKQATTLLKRFPNCTSEI